MRATDHLLPLVLAVLLTSCASEAPMEVRKYMAILYGENKTLTTVPEDAPTARCANGIFVGKRSAWVCSFKGIPYALPPTGNRRWQRAQPVSDDDAIGSKQKVLGRIKNTDHGDVLKRGDAYMTAWMRYWLCDDQEAGKCFLGDSAEILSNEAWQDVKR